MRTKVAVMSGPAAKRMRGGEFDGTEGDHSVQHVHAGDQEAVAAACHDRLDTLQDQVTEGGEKDAITRCPANSAGGGSDHHDDGKGYLSNMLVRCKICYCCAHRNICSDEFVLTFQTMTIYANVRGMPVFHIRAAESACSVRERLVSTTDVLHCFEPAVTIQNPYVQLSGSAGVIRNFFHSARPSAFSAENNRSRPSIYRIVLEGSQAGTAQHTYAILARH